MKLGEYLYKKVMEGKEVGGPNEYSNFGVIPTQKDIEHWIYLWYKETYNKEPPTWLSNKEME